MVRGYLLDTNIISYLLEGQDGLLIERIVSVEESRLFVSAITCYELMHRGRLLQLPDMFIAAQAMANNLVLISHDHRAFEGLAVEGLFWEDWCQAFH